MSKAKDGMLRLGYTAAFLLLVLAEVLIALYVRDAFVRPYGGDVLVMGVLYCLVRVFFPRDLRWLPVWLFIFAVCVEAAQAADYVTLLGLQNSRFFSILLGSSFSWGDILCYAVGSALCGLVQAVAQPCKKEKKKLY